ncbi:hypothetical protein HU200_009573 [Digitaria exilis]|uniref:Uncharacterized protein n=1 Tax=Digitaria exilis TaxID=1010633 RepID=A0A835FKS5_9POAL|nr:hypothetical protein HU200_009573 [Digitaria exilis]
MPFDPTIVERGRLLRGRRGGARGATVTGHGRAATTRPSPWRHHLGRLHLGHRQQGQLQARRPTSPTCIVLRGCPAAAVRHDDPAALQLQLMPGSCGGAEYAVMTARKRMEMRRWRRRQMLYTAGVLRLIIQVTFIHRQPDLSFDE